MNSKQVKILKIKGWVKKINIYSYQEIIFLIYASKVGLVGA